MLVPMMLLLMFTWSWKQHMGSPLTKQKTRTSREVGSDLALIVRVDKWCIFGMRCNDALWSVQCKFRGQQGLWPHMFILQSSLLLTKPITIVRIYTEDSQKKNLVFGSEVNFEREELAAYYCPIGNAYSCIFLTRFKIFWSWKSGCSTVVLKWDGQDWTDGKDLQVRWGIQRC